MNGQSTSSKPFLCERDPTVSPSEAVVTAVADVRGVDVLDLEPPLYDAINPDALNALFEDRVGGHSLTFSYAGYTVTLDESAVTLTER